MGFIARALAEQYTCCWYDVRPCPLPDEPHAYSVLLGFEDGQSIRRFNVHAYVRQDRTIAASGLLDPKFFLDDALIAYKVEA